jgi:hypothetical protein
LFIVGTSFGADFVCATTLVQNENTAVRIGITSPFLETRDAEVFCHHN